jgi:hypothetical protein
LIDADEAKVRTVPCRVTNNLPALQNGNDTVTLSDTSADVVTVDNVTVSNFSTTIGLGTGSEVIFTTTSDTVSVDETCTPPASATVTNTAHLDGGSSSVTVQVPQIGTDPITGQPICQTFTFACVTGVDFDARSGVSFTCEAEEMGFQPGDFCTYTNGRLLAGA